MTRKGRPAHEQSGLQTGLRFRAVFACPYLSNKGAIFCGPNVGLLADVRVDAFGRCHIGFGASVVSFSLSVETPIEICIGVVRIEPDRLAVVGDSALIVLLIFICERAVVEGDRDVFLCVRTPLNYEGGTRRVSMLTSPST